MPTYGFKCLKCKVEFELADPEISIRECYCPDCKSPKLRIVSFDNTPDGLLMHLVREVRSLHRKVDRLLEALEDEDDEQSSGNGEKPH